MALLAFDLETVPDVQAGRRISALSGTDVEVAAAMVQRREEETKGRTAFLKPALHRVVGLGLVRVDVTGGQLRECSVRGWAGEGEPDLLRRFFAALHEYPQLVSWNGNGFDLPALRARALLYQLDTRHLDGPIAQKPWESYLNRYSERHVDLMDVLAGYGASPPLSLHEAARLCGLPGKGAVDGSQVADLAQAMDWPAIQDYVQSDALQTMWLFLRWQVGRGQFPAALYHQMEPGFESQLAALQRVAA